MTTQHLWFLIAAGFALQLFSIYLMLRRIYLVEQEHAWWMNRISKQIRKIYDSVEDDSQDFK